MSSARVLPLKLLRAICVNREQSSLRHARSEIFHRQGKHVADATLGADNAWCAGIRLQLAPEAQYLHVDAAVADILMDPRGLKQMFSAQRPLRRIQEGDQQCVFALCQSHRTVVGVGQPSNSRVQEPATETASPVLRTALRQEAP